MRAVVQIGWDTVYRTGKFLHFQAVKYLEKKKKKINLLRLLEKETT